MQMWGGLQDPRSPLPIHNPKTSLLRGFLHHRCSGTPVKQISVHWSMKSSQEGPQKLHKNPERGSGVLNFLVKKKQVLVSLFDHSLEAYNFFMHIFLNRRGGWVGSAVKDRVLEKIWMTYLRVCGGLVIFHFL